MKYLAYSPFRFYNSWPAFASKDSLDTLIPVPVFRIYFLELEFSVLFLCISLGCRCFRMDQFSHDLTVALEETSLLDRAKVSRWGQQRRRTRSTGNLRKLGVFVLQLILELSFFIACAPQPTEDSSSPTDAALGASVQTATNNNDGLDTVNVNLPSDSDDKEELGVPRLACKSLSTARVLGTLESDSLNETFSPARYVLLDGMIK